MVEERATGNAWRARPVLATALRLAIMLVPIGASLAVTAALGRVVPVPKGPWAAAWVVGLLACAVLTAIGVERLARRLLPLVTLLKLSMLFPDLAPTRFSIARTAGSVRKLEARLQEAENDPAAREESETVAPILSRCLALQSHDRTQAVTPNGCACSRTCSARNSSSRRPIGIASAGRRCSTTSAS